MKNIGFVGLGHMGNPMVSNLIKSGFTVYVNDVNKQAVEALKKEGAIPAASPKEMVKKVDVMMTMVQTSKQVEEICLGEFGFFQDAKSSLIYIDCSSIDITTSRAIHQKAKEKGMAMLDAPVSGGVAGAVAATLTMMVGGEKEDFDRAQPILKVLGKKVIHAGAAGTGQAAKICNNLLLGVSMIGVCESFILGEKLGLDPKKFFEICSNSSGQCWSMTSYCPVPGILENVPSTHGYQPGFMAKMMLKDLRLGQHAAESVNVAVPLAAVAAELYELYVDQGHGEVDFSGIIKMFSG